MINEIKVYFGDVSNPFDRAPPDSGHCLLGGRLRQRSNQAHRHSSALARDTRRRDAGMRQQRAGGEKSHSGLGLGHSGHRCSFPDSGILIFTSASGDCAAVSFENSGTGRQTGWGWPSPARLV
ncbi:hypothetical protein [Kamptonema formosum]|uniref:hypothetical protein n=1 Tax=Kamptonema formosum TaxID=331992 RepID=UPI00036E1D0C|nr:hypothetical protein [Oscillatoria sp. PCC 10802]